MKKLVILFLTFLIVLTFATAFAISAQTKSPENNTNHIYIDPGHGSLDGGAGGNNIYEITLTLAIGLKLAQVL